MLSSPGSYNERYKKDGTLIDPGVDRLVEVCAAAGVDGLETIYTYDCNKPYFRSPQETIDLQALYSLIDHYEALAARCGMVATGGSDFHGNSKPQISLGALPVPYRYLENLRRAAGR